jgi:uncharacterized phiE125 gp8 family phage protein
VKFYRSLVRATQPAVEPVTLAEAKEHLRVDISTDDALISAIVKASREFCEEYLDRSLVYTQWTMRMDAIPWEIELPRPPVAQAGTTTATVVTYTLETQATATLDTSTYRVDRTATPGVIRTVYAGTWPSHLFDENSVSVTWWGGYGADGTAVPAAVRSAMLMMIGSLYEHRSAVLAGSISKEIEFGVKALLDTQRWGSYR